jgi:adenylate cyclase
MNAVQDGTTRPPDPVRASGASDHTAVVEALGQVLGSTTFAGAPRSRDLLGFVATETIAGRGHLLNERVISRLALGRPATIDTRTDASARVQARRTRELLDRYYAEEGRGDRLRISIPVGQYAAAFAEHHDHTVEPDRARERRASAEPILTVVQLRHRPTGVERRVAAGLTESAVQMLARFPGLRVVGPVLGGPTTAIESVVSAVGSRTGADFVLHGGVRANNDTVRVTVHLADARSGTTTWSETFERPVDAFTGFEAEDDILGYVVAAVGDFGGFVLREPITGLAVDRSSPVALALSKYYAYLDELTPSIALEVISALEQAADLEPDNAHVIASLGFIHAVGVLMLGANAVDSMVAAETLGRQALKLDPANPTGHNILGIVELARGHESPALQHAETALALTPYHPGNAYVAGMLIGASGDWDRGIGIIRRVVRHNPYGPKHRHTLLAIDALLRDDVAEALTEASLLHFPGYIYGPLLKAICLRELGLADDADAELEIVLELRPDFLEHPADVLAEAPTIPTFAAEHLAGRLA